MRWIEYDDTFLCLNHVTHFGFAKWSGFSDKPEPDRYEVRAYLNVGFDAPAHSGMDSMQHYIVLDRRGTSPAYPRGIIMRILEGQYDIPNICDDRIMIRGEIESV
jgi:hypothetical protein